MCAAHHMATVRVLLVEDFQISARFLSSALKVSKCSVVYTAESGESGMKLLRSVGPVDLVMVDIMMQGIGGLKCISLIRELELEQQWSIKIVAMSADDEKREEALAAGADMFLHKLNQPVKAIIDIIKQIVAEKSKSELLSEGELVEHRHSV